MDVATTIATLVVGAVFGLALAAPPGPMNAVIAEESVLRGWLAGVTAGLGAMSADFLFFVLSLAGVAAVLRDAATARAVMVGFGGLIMLYFAYDAAQEGQAVLAAGEDATSGESGGFTAGETGDGLPDGRGFRKAFVLALTNPYQILFWVTVGVGLLEPGTVDVFSHLPGGGGPLAGTLVVNTGSAALLAGLFGGIGVWIVGFPALLVGVGRRVDTFAPAVAALSAVVLAGFGVTFCWTATTTLLG